MKLFDQSHIHPDIHAAFPCSGLPLGNITHFITKDWVSPTTWHILSTQVHRSHVYQTLHRFYTYLKWSSAVTCAAATSANGRRQEEQVQSISLKSERWILAFVKGVSSLWNNEWLLAYQILAIVSATDCMILGHFIFIFLGGAHRRDLSCY